MGPRSQHDTALSKLEQRCRELERVLQNLPDIYYRTDAAGTIVYCSGAMAGALGYPDDELLGKPMSGIYFSAEERERVLAQIMEARGDYVQVEARVRRKDGDVRWASTRAHALFDAAGRFAGVEGISRDVTEQKKSEILLRENEERLQLALGAAHQAWFDLDLKTEEVVVSPEYPKLLGYEPAEFRTNLATWMDSIHPDDRAAVMAVFQSALASNEIKEMTYRRRAKSGDWIWISSLGRVVERDASGKPLRMTGIHTDVNERRLAEETVKAQELKYRTLFETANDGIFLLDARGFIDCNQRGAAMYGRAREDIIGRAPTDFSPERQPDGRLSAEVAMERIQAAMRGEPQLFEWQSLRADGKPFDVEITVTRIEIGSATYMLAIVRDIADRKQAEATMTQQKEYLQTIFEAEPECVKVMTAAGSLESMNRAGLEMLEVDSLEEARSIGLINFVDPAYRDAFSKLHREVCAGKSGTLEFPIKGKNGTVRWLETHAAPLPDAIGKGVKLLGVTRDITEHKSFREELERQAHVDYLTGLNNRRHFMQLAELELARAKRYRSSLSLFMLDIDLFKQVNDTHGHKVGDAVLAKFGEVCLKTLREIDVIGRVGGEEFAILLPETGIDVATEAGERLRAALANTRVPLESGLPIQFTVSIGVASLASDDDNLDVLLSRADRALYEAKQSGRNRVCAANK